MELSKSPNISSQFADEGEADHHVTDVVSLVYFNQAVQCNLTVFLVLCKTYYFFFMSRIPRLPCGKWSNEKHAIGWFEACCMGTVYLIVEHHS